MMNKYSYVHGSIEDLEPWLKLNMVKFQMQCFIII
jgi:hypothetical protein